MRVAALYDVHGNLPALEAVLAERDVETADAVLVGGDVVAGPFPGETLEALLALGDRARLIRGNAERQLFEPDPDDAWGERARWTRGRLTPTQLDLLGSLPHPLSLDGTLYCHGSPRSDDEILTPLTPDERLAAVLAGVEERLVVCGHTHVQFDRSVAGRRIVNAGSVGRPYEGRRGAFWALVDGGDVDLRRTEYDVEDAVRGAFAGGYPEPEELEETLLDPPGGDEAAAFFEQMAADRGER